MPSSPSTPEVTPPADTDYDRPDARFVPIRARDLATAIVSDVERFGPDAPAIEKVADALRDVIEREATEFERVLTDQYAAFNPDRETQALDDLEQERAPVGHTELTRRIDYLLGKANFEQLSTAQIEAAVRTANSHGLRVKLHGERIDYLSIWVRGRGKTQRRRRTWRRPIRPQVCDMPVYRRLAVVARLRDDPHVILKMFKEIPVDDVEALLPHAEVGMSWLDRIMLLGGGAGTVGMTATKAFKIAIGVMYWSKLAWVLLVGAVVLAVRTVLGYRSARTKRDSQRTQHLYYQNLANNAGVIHTLLSMIMQEEIKEAVLAYAMCAATNNPVTSHDDLRGQVEAYLLERFGVRVDFDIDDAVETLTRLGLWRDPAQTRVRRPDGAIQRLNGHRQDRRATNYHERMADGVPHRSAGGESGNPETVHGV